jgi:hypothetical protein
MAWTILPQGRLAAGKGCGFEKIIFAALFQRSAMRFRYRSIGKQTIRLLLEAAHK